MGKIASYITMLSLYHEEGIPWEGSALVRYGLESVLEGLGLGEEEAKRVTEIAHRLLVVKKKEG